MLIEFRVWFTGRRFTSGSTNKIFELSVGEIEVVISKQVNNNTH